MIARRPLYAIAVDQVSVKCKSTLCEGSMEERIRLWCSSDEQCGVGYQRVASYGTRRHAEVDTSLTFFSYSDFCIGIQTYVNYCYTLETCPEYLGFSLEAILQVIGRSNFGNRGKADLKFQCAACDSRSLTSLIYIRRYRIIKHQSKIEV